MTRRTIGLLVLSPEERNRACDALVPKLQTSPCGATVGGSSASLQTGTKAKRPGMHRGESPIENSQSVPAILQFQAVAVKVSHRWRSLKARI